MSGGSYNYLCWHSNGLEAQRYDISTMAERLEKSGYYGPARATRNILVLLDGAERAAKALEDVWHAVEWADSGDSNEGRVREEVAKFEPWPPPADREQPVRKIAYAMTDDEVQSMREQGIIDADGKTMIDRIMDRLTEPG